MFFRVVVLLVVLAIVSAGLPSKPTVSLNFVEHALPSPLCCIVSYRNSKFSLLTYSHRSLLTSMIPMLTVWMV